MDVAKTFFCIVIVSLLQVGMLLVPVWLKLLMVLVITN